MDLGAAHGGLYAYGEFDDAHSYYRGIYPEHELGELSGRFDLPDNWKFGFDVQYYHSTGDVQTPGWNRLTQNLIDNQIYITGRNTALSNTPGVRYLAPGQTVVPARPPGFPTILSDALYGHRRRALSGLLRLRPRPHRGLHPGHRRRNHQARSPRRLSQPL